MEVKLLVFLVITASSTWPNANGDGACHSSEVKSTSGIIEENEDYYDEYGEHVCCRPKYRYETLFSYAICTYHTLKAGENLHVYGGDTSKLKYVTFQSSRIDLIPVGVFSSVSSTSQLYLNDSHVNSIHPGAFTGLTNLAELHLERNSIAEVARGTFNSLTTLALLDISDNKVEVIEKNAFLGLFNLEKLVLKNNMLVNLSSNAFDGLTTLRLLDLSHNFISNISPHLFANVSDSAHGSMQNNLSIDLSYNHLAFVDLSDFPSSVQDLNLNNNVISSLIHGYLPIVDRLDLSNNQLQDIEEVYETLKYFNLSGNKINQLNSSLFEKSQKLDVLDLSHNSLTNLNEDMFANMTQLTFLYLQNNELSNIPIGCFRNQHNLNSLNMSSNRITEFEFGTFTGLTGLISLDISNNSLTYLFKSAFHALSSLKDLNVGSNSITIFDPNDLLSYAKSLETVALEHNSWNCESLLTIIDNLQQRGVSVRKGRSQKVKNVHGIACSSYPSVAESSNYDTSKDREIILKLSTLSKELSALQKFFDDELFNSSKYFNDINRPMLETELNEINDYVKQFDQEFKNTSFYKYIQGDIATDGVSKNFVHVVEKLSRELNSLDEEFLNTSLYKFATSDKISTSFVDSIKNFDTSFKNSAFYKYFSKDFSDFRKYFENDLPSTVDGISEKISVQLHSLRNYFDNDFKNSAFYKFFENEHESFINDIQVEGPHFAKYADNREYEEQNKEMLSKISDSQSNVSTLLIVIAIMLLVIAVLIVINNVPNSFKRMMPKLSRKAAPTESVTDLELV